MTGATIVRGKRRSVLKGKTKEMYSIVRNSIGKGWFKNTMRSNARGNNYAVYNNSGKLAGYAVMGKNLPHLGGSTYLHQPAISLSGVYLRLPKQCPLL